MIKRKKSGFDSSRRQFFKRGAFVVASLALFRIGTGRGLGALAQAEETVVSETEPMSQAMGYKKDASKVDVKKFPKRAGAEGKKQFCDNCQFYAKANGKQGKCQIFTNRLVEAKGWCNTWTKKA